MKNYSSLSRYLLMGISIISTVAAGFFVFQNIQLRNKQNLANTQHQQTTKQLSTKITQLQKEYRDTLNQLELTKEEREKLAQDLEEQKEKVDDIEDEYDRINDTVSDLLKLENTDKELLQKYSKVYFLNENYVPSSLVDIDRQYLHGSKQLQIHGKVWPFLEEMLEDAERDDVNLRILSAYRSFQYQQQIKQTYVTIYGTGANKFSADQGYSEHQLGTTVDFTNPANGPALSKFESTDEFKWLKRHAHKYGFTLSYPKHNGYYQYEPWHWRFVGKKLADDLKGDGKYFYDYDQRDINKYLLELFD